MPKTEKIEVGDHVYIGEGIVHWVVLKLFESVKEVVVTDRQIGEITRWNNRPVPVANLRSGMTGRVKRNVALGRLRLHSKGAERA